MPRFVILRHEMSTSPRAGVHWDFMLERDGKLRTWALVAEPVMGVEIAADALADHRIDYLQYEGPIGGDRGEVRRWDEGQSEVRYETPIELAVELKGTKLAGTAYLKRADAAAERWTFLLSADKT